MVVPHARPGLPQGDTLLQRLADALLLLLDLPRDGEHLLRAVEGDGEGTRLVPEDQIPRADLEFPPR